MRSLKLFLLFILFPDRELWGATSDLCAEDERVVSNKCQQCPDSYANEAGDDPSGSDTLCRKCAVDYYVDSNECKACPPGTENEVKDIVSGGDTTALTFCVRLMNMSLTMSAYRVPWLQ